MFTLKYWTKMQLNRTACYFVVNPSVDFGGDFSSVMSESSTMTSWYQGGSYMTFINICILTVLFFFIKKRGASKAVSEHPNPTVFPSQFWEFINELDCGILGHDLSYLMSPWCTVWRDEDCAKSLLVKQAGLLWVCDKMRLCCPLLDVLWKYQADCLFLHLSETLHVGGDLYSLFDLFLNSSALVTWFCILNWRILWVRVFYFFTCEMKSSMSSLYLWEARYDVVVLL